MSEDCRRVEIETSALAEDIENAARSLRAARIRQSQNGSRQAIDSSRTNPVPDLCGRRVADGAEAVGMTSGCVVVR